MQDVEESVALMISLSGKTVSEVADLLFKAIHALANREGDGESKPGLVATARQALERKIPGIGDHGEVSAATLHKGGAEVSVATIGSEDLSQLKSELHKEGVDFSVVQNADGTAAVLFRAKDFELMQNALAQVGGRLGISEEDLAFAAMAPEVAEGAQEQSVEEIEHDAEGETQAQGQSQDGTEMPIQDASEPEEAAEVQEQGQAEAQPHAQRQGPEQPAQPAHPNAAASHAQEQPPEQKEEKERQDVAGQAGTHLGVTWTPVTVTASAEPALEAQVAECDLTAKPDGTWSVSIAGAEVAAGKSTVPDLTGAMIDATASAKATVTGHDLLQGVTWQQGHAPSLAAGDGQPTKAAQQRPEHTVASVAKQARAKAQSAKQVHAQSQDAPKQKRPAPRR